MSAFRDQVAIVTGGASGIGRGLVEALAAAGARVVIADVALEPAEELAAALRAGGGQVRAARLDVTDAAAFAALVEETAAREGRLDILFNNAGIAVLGEVRDLTLDHWRRVLAVNLDGVVHGVQAAYPLMIRQGRGHIVNTASMAGLIPAPLLTPYATTKHAVVGLSLSLRAEAAAHGVRVSAVCPGLIATRIAEHGTWVGLDREQALASVGARAMAPDACAREVLRGVQRNRGLIVVTGHARAAWFLHRFFPWLLELGVARGLRKFRAARGG